MTVTVSANDSTVNWLTASFVVLNRTSVGSQEIYEVNVTIVEPNIAVPSSNLTTTVTQSGGTRGTVMEAMLASVSSNGTVISANGETGYFALNLYQQNMNFFSFLNLRNFPPDHSVVISRTTIQIGSTSMNVTNYAVPSTIIIQTMQGCDGSAASMFTESLLDQTMQVGIVPGTNFTLLTLYSLRVSIGSNSTSTGGSQEFPYQIKVVSFSKA